MDQNEQLLLKQVTDARAALAEAVAAQDPLGLSRALDELEEALRQAREGSVDVSSETVSAEAAATEAAVAGASGAGGSGAGASEQREG
ncbi:hypothetical protein ABIA32_002556 [Streptacidiphilus sp. MAP12-20]|uniref:hypothetical protein n=1 Tax=Streptacidiphilus sp. MAP12-20 TaxID=3156299 RepID=UPI0035161FB0